MLVCFIDLLLNQYISYMSQIQLLSFNVNGIRAAEKKGFLNWLYNTKPDILCLQETKVDKSQLNRNLLEPHGYHTYWNSGVKKGYSGTAIFSRVEPLCVEFCLGMDEFDTEGRILIAKYHDFTLLNCYFPNGGCDLLRVPFKLAFYHAFLGKCKELSQKGDTVIFCGDVNTAHKNIDLARPQTNKNKTGFLPEERTYIDKFIENGYVDTFRFFYPNLTEQYTWWSNRANARKNNVGWRLDYFFIADKAIERVTSAFIMPEIHISDHCPIGIKLQVNSQWEKGEKNIEKVQPIYYQLKLPGL